MSERLVAEGLMMLSEKISELCPDLQRPGFLGGDHGYGCDFENGEFGMHHYCWCERDDCLWCTGHESMADHLLCTRGDRDEPCECRLCNIGPVEYGGIPGRRAPNFWHKPSGAKVWWYKYIGRGMDIIDPEESLTWLKVLSACMDSLSSGDEDGG